MKPTRPDRLTGPVARRAPTRIAAAVATTLAAAHAAPAAADTWHLEDDGVVVVEVESIDAPPNWAESRALGDVLGESYFINVGPNGSPGSQSVMRYRVTISEPGFYEFRWRTRIGEGDDYKEANDSWLRLPTGRDIPGEQSLENWSKVYMNRLGRWTWDTVTVDFAPRPIRQYLDAGDHEIEIAGRSTGHAIDRFVLYRYDDHEFSEARLDTLEPSRTSDAPTTPGGATESPLRPDTPDDFMPVGECRFGRLVLEPVADVDVEGTDVDDGTTLTVDAGGRRALLRFDLANVPDINIARLRTTAAAPVTGDRRDFWLGGDEIWDEDSAADALPDGLVALGSDADAHEADERIDVALDPSFVAAPALTVIVEAAGGSGIELRSREADAGRPRLVLKGDDRFCADYVAGGGTGQSEDEDGGASTDGTADGETDGETDGTTDGTDDAGADDSGSDDAGGDEAGTDGAGTDDGNGDGDGDSDGADSSGEGDGGDEDAGDGDATSGDDGSGAGGDGGGGGDDDGDVGVTTDPADGQGTTPAKRSSGGGALGLGPLALLGLAGALRRVGAGRRSRRG